MTARPAYEIIYERHRAGAMIVTSNRGPDDVACHLRGSRRGALSFGSVPRPGLRDAGERLRVVGENGRKRLQTDEARARVPSVPSTSRLLSRACVNAQGHVPGALGTPQRKTQP